MATDRDEGIAFIPRSPKLGQKSAFAALFFFVGAVRLQPRVDLPPPYHVVLMIGHVTAHALTGIVSISDPSLGVVRRQTSVTFTV